MTTRLRVDAHGGLIGLVGGSDHLVTQVALDGDPVLRDALLLSDPDLLESIRGNVLTQGSFHGDTLLYSKAGQPRWVSLVINASDESSGGVSSSTARTAPMIASSGSVIASVISLAWI